MINKRASNLPHQLIRKYGSNDPYELASIFNIDVMERSEF